MESFHVNNEIKLYNRKLTKHVKTFDHTTVLEINLNMELFTLHGLHLNGRGKERISKQIAAQISTILGKKAESPVSLGWESDLKKGATAPVLENKSEVRTNKENGSNQADTSDSEVSFPRTSHRQKKFPVTRKSNFLW
jgi:hypothetical protein